jgi:hypothetical protein
MRTTSLVALSTMQTTHCRGACCGCISDDTISSLVQTAARPKEALTLRASEVWSERPHVSLSDAQSESDRLLSVRDAEHCSIAAGACGALGDLRSCLQTDQPK